MKNASDELLELAENAPMSAGTRTKLRDLALRVAAIERERSMVSEMHGKALGRLVDAVAERPGNYGKTTATT